LKLSSSEPTGLAHLDCHVWGAIKVNSAKV